MLPVSHISCHMRGLCNHSEAPALSGSTILIRGLQHALTSHAFGKSPKPATVSGKWITTSWTLKVCRTTACWALLKSFYFRYLWRPGWVFDYAITDPGPWSRLDCKGLPRLGVLSIRFHGPAHPSNTLQDTSKTLQ